MVKSATTLTAKMLPRLPRGRVIATFQWSSWIFKQPYRSHASATVAANLEGKPNDDATTTESSATTTTNTQQPQTDTDTDKDDSSTGSPLSPTSSPITDSKLDLSHQRLFSPGQASVGWTERVVDKDDEESLLFRIGQQELSGGRMRSRQQGVLHEDPVIDHRLMIQNYTVASLASALRDREDALQQAAVMAEDCSDMDMQELLQFLKMFHPRYVLERREKKNPDLTQTLDVYSLEWLRKMLMRMPRAVVSAHTKRAAVVLPLCTVKGVPCLLLEKRAPNLRAHADEVCLPGGMYCEVTDRNIVNTCLREMKEEIGGLSDENIQVLGVFRCNWGEVHHLVGIAVTPVVCFLGELPDDLHPNPEEVSQVFTVSLEYLVDPGLWIHKEGLAPQFLGGPYPIWGLTGYILDRFRKDVLRPTLRGQHPSSPSGGASSPKPK